MDNKTKQYLSQLEKRVLKLETAFDAISLGISSVKYSSGYTCNQCNAFDPQETNYVCSQFDCCQGLNPMDDEIVTVPSRNDPIGG